MEGEDFKQSVAQVFPLWLFRLNNCLGTMPLSVTRSGLKFSWLSALRGLVIVLFVFYIFILKDLGLAENHAQQESVNNREKFSIKRMTASVNLILIQSGAIVSLSIAGVRSYLKHFDAIIDYLVEFEKFWDKNIPKNMIQEKGDWVNAVSIGALLYGVGLMMPVMYYEMSVNRYFIEHADIMIVYFVICKLLLVMSLLVFLRIAKSLARGFRRLNSVVKYCLANEPDDRKICSVFTLTAKKEEMPKITIEEVRRLHMILSDVIDEINSFLGWQLMFIFTVFLMDSVSFPYYIMKNVIDQPAMPSIWLNSLNCLVSFLHTLFLLIYTSILASDATYHAKRTAFYVSRLLSFKLSRDTRKEVKYALDQICHSKTTFNVLNLFKIETPLITSILGIAVSYLVVILQFEGAATSQRNKV